MRIHNNRLKLKGIATPAAAMLLLACPLSSAFALTVNGPGTVLMIDHPQYQEETELAAATVSELSDDLGGR